MLPNLLLAVARSSDIGERDKLAALNAASVLASDMDKGLVPRNLRGLLAAAAAAAAVDTAADATLPADSAMAVRTLSALAPVQAALLESHDAGGDDEVEDEDEDEDDEDDEDDEEDDDEDNDDGDEDDEDYKVEEDDEDGDDNSSASSTTCYEGVADPCMFTRSMSLLHNWVVFGTVVSCISAAVSIAALSRVLSTPQ